MSGLILHAEDFNLRYSGAGPIVLHTTLTHEGRGERLTATARNESGAPILHAKICVLSDSLKKGCLFELWNTVVWEPNAELSWNITSARKVPNLTHGATVEEFEGTPAPATTRSAAAVSVAPPAPAAPSPAPVMEFSNPLVSRGPMLVLQDGTPLRMRLTRNLSSSEAQSGDRVDFEVLDEVKVGNTVVVASGAIAIATVTDSEAKRSMGRAGRLDVTLDYVRSVDGEKVRLRGVQDTKGGGHAGAMTGAMVATAVVFWPAAPLFLFMKGKDVRIPKGHEVTVYVNGDQQIQGPTSVRAPAPSREAGTNEKPAVRSKTGGKPITNEDVLTLKTAGFGDDFIISKINASTSSFSLDTPDLVKLKQAGLSDAVIGAMVQAAIVK